MMITAPAQIKAVIAFATSSLLLAQTIPTGAGSLDSIGRVSLDAALIIAVGVLWRKIDEKDAQLGKKDDQLIAMTSKVTEVMTSVMEAVKENRKTSEDLGVQSRKTFEELTARIDEVGNALDNIAENFSAWQQARGEPRAKATKAKE